jgi:hypothetical protein
MREESTASKIKLVAIDLAKRCDQMAAIDEHGKVLYNRKLSPAKFALAIQQLEPAIIAMEACSAAHYWDRRLIASGSALGPAAACEARRASSRCTLFGRGWASRCNAIACCELRAILKV